MALAKVIDARLELLLAGDPVTGDSLDKDLSELISQINELVPEPVIPPGIAEAHLAKIVETAGSQRPQPAPQPAKTARLGWMAQLRSLSATPARKIAAATLSLTAAFSGLAYAGVLPDPIQRTAADLASLVGVTLPDPDVIADTSDSPAEPDDPDRHDNNEPVDEAGAVDEGEQGSDDGGPSVDGEGRNGEHNKERNAEDKDNKERNAEDKDNKERNAEDKDNKERNGKDEDKKERNANLSQGDDARAKSGWVKGLPR